MKNKSKLPDAEVIKIKAQQGALATQLAVVTMFCKTIIHTLNPEQRDFVEASLRSGLNQLLDLSDDNHLFAAHSSTILVAGNVFLSEFERLRQGPPSPSSD